MPTKLTVAERRALEGELIPLVSEWVEAHAGVLSEKGRSYAEQSIGSANLGTGAGTRKLLAPVMLIAAAVEPRDIDGLYRVVDRIPFTGDHSQWHSVGAVYSAAARIYLRAGDSVRAEVALEMIAWPENGERRVNPFTSGISAFAGRVNGRTLGNLVNYPRPARSVAAMQHLISAVTEWTNMWAFGGSEVWPRERIDDSIAEAVREAALYLADPV